MVTTTDVQLEQADNPRNYTNIHVYCFGEILR
jgi:hypothetical protein